MKSASDGHNESCSPFVITSASCNGQLTNCSNGVWRNTFVVHCCGLVRRLRNIRLNGALRILSRPYYRLRFHTIVHFLVFQLLVVVEVVTSFVLSLRFDARTMRTYGLMCACASPSGGSGVAFKSERRLLTL